MRALICDNAYTFALKHTIVLDTSMIVSDKLSSSRFESKHYSYPTLMHNITNYQAKWYIIPGTKAAWRGIDIFSNSASTSSSFSSWVGWLKSKEAEWLLIIWKTFGGGGVHGFLRGLKWHFWIHLYCSLKSHDLSFIHICSVQLICFQIWKWIFENPT